MLSDDELGPVVAYLTRIIRPKTGNPMLHQAEITHHAGYDDFRSFAADFWEAATYPAPQSHKYETFSWSPTFYEDSYWRPKSRPDQDAKHGTWRVGEAAHDQVTVAYFDLDNQFSTRTMFTIDAVEEVLKTVRVSYLLYTSYSHKPEHHKVRIIVPINREATWDEMFHIFAVVNALFDYQLDGSIYDQGDHLYGPTYTGERRQFLDGKSLDVDAWLAVPLTEEDQSFAQRAKNKTGRTTRREMSPAEIETYRAKINDFSVVGGVNIENPAIFNPEWFRLLDELYMGGSRHQTLYGLMTKVWLKSKGQLSFGEMQTIQGEIDLRMGFYCTSRYGRGTLVTDLRSVMSNVVAPSFDDDRRYKIDQTMKRLNKKLSK